MKFYLDENVDPAVAAALRLRGIDAIATQEVAQKGFSDERPLAFAATEGRVIVTHDADLLRWHSRGGPHGGIAFIGSNRCSLGDLIRKLVLLHETVDQNSIRDRVEYL